MIRRLPLGLSAALLFSLVAPARAATVSGRVLDSGGAPVAGAKVTWEAYRTDEQTLLDDTQGAVPAALGETATDAAGRFQVKLEKPGIEVSIRVMPGALPAALLGGPYDASEDVALDDVELPAVEKISGRISDESGKPVADARIRATGGLPFEEADVVFYAEAKSAADGAYSIPNAPVGGGGLSVRATGYSPLRQPSAQRRTTVNVTLKKGGTIRGIVTDPAGKPAEGATVISGSLAAKSDSSGAWSLTGVPPGTREVEAFWKDDLAARRDTVHVKKGEAVDAGLRLGKAASITGSVVDEKTRRPIAGVRVWASATSFFRGDARSRRARTDAKGRFRIPALAPRRYTVRAAKAEYLPVAMPGIVAAVSPPGTVAIALQKAAAVSGRVTDEAGLPVPGARVRFARDSNVRALLRGGPAAFLGRPGVTTGPDGAFRIRGLAAEKNLTLEAAKTGYVTAKRHGVTLKPGEAVKDVTLVVRRGLEARGRVVDSAGQPIAGAEIRLSPVERGGGRFMFQIAGVSREKPDTTSGADGSFRVAGLEAGEYALTVSREGYAPKRVPSATVAEKGPNDWPEIVLAAGVPIAGVVRSSKGDAIVGAEVFAFAEGTSRNSRTDPEGKFRLEGFGAERRVMLNVMAEGYSALQKQITPSPEEVVLVLATSGTIRGRVEDAATNRPITDFTASYADARGQLAGAVRVVMGLGEREKAFQSPDGSFELADVPPGKWGVRVSAPGYRPAEVSGIEIAEGETKEGVVVALRKGAVISGRVLDARRGTGVANASVAWSEGSGASGMGPGMAVLSRLDAGGVTAATTDADGRFRFEGLPAGKITLSAEHPDFLEASKMVELDDEATVDLTLGLGGSISGTVVGKDGRTGIPGAEVFLSEEGDDFRGDDSARADASGNFAFEHLKPGRYRVSARSSVGATAWKDVVLGESQQQDGVLLEMATGATIRGTVSGLPAGKVGGIRVFASTKDFSDSAVTGDDGRFAFRDVPSGVLRLTASTPFPAMRSTSKNVDVPEGATEVPAEIVFEGNSRLAGRVTRGDTPLTGAFVSATPDPPSATAGRASDQTDEDGRYSIEGLTDGNYQVRVSGQSSSYRRDFTVSGDTNGDIALPMLAISGIVTDAGSNEPIPGAFIQAETGQERTGVPARYTQTDSRGFYSLDDLDSGSYQVTARKEGYQLKTLPVSVASAPAELNVSLTRGAGLTIRAADGLTGIPLRSVTALAYTGTGSLAFTGSISLDAEGKGEISSLTPGSYSLYLFSGGYASRSYPVTVPSPMLSIALTPGGRVEVRTDVPFTGRLVDAAGAPYMIFPGRLDARVSGAPPAVSWGSLAPGSYRLLVSGASGESAYPFTVVEGQTTTVAIR
ncbi:MAG TPA: carboxypeptidase regulatory-like domain-containing protein [Thermoanaerobaculia bacterium]|nr:carboxypeptidase regulatory-like domain-containing protein [Thermoanaerobaculia bacterium]